MSSQDQTTTDLGTGRIDEKLQTGTILATASGMPEIAAIAEALRASAFAAVLDGPGYHTLFAPASGSFEPDSVGSYVVAGGQKEADLRTAKELRTLAGETLPVAWETDGARVGGAKIVRRDIACINGFIHVIDKPLA